MNFQLILGFKKVVVFLSFQIFSPKAWGEKTSCFLQGEFRGAGLSGSLPVTVGGGSVGLFEKQQPKKMVRLPGGRFFEKTPFLKASGNAQYCQYLHKNDGKEKKLLLDFRLSLTTAL